MLHCYEFIKNVEMLTESPGWSNFWRWPHELALNQQSSAISQIISWHMQAPCQHGCYVLSLLDRQDGLSQQALLLSLPQRLRLGCINRQTTGQSGPHAGMYMHAHMHAYTCARTCTHARTHACMHTHTCTHPSMCKEFTYAVWLQ